MQSTIERRLAEYATTAAGDAGDTTRSAVRLSLLDTLSCIIAGSRSDECRRLRELLGDGGDGNASATGSGRRMPAAAAAMCNAAMAHWYEWDDLHDKAVVHASAVIWPVLLATAEASGGVSGAEIMAAAVVAYDIAVRIGESLTPYAHNGWYATAPACAVGAAAGAARLRRLSVDGVHAAMGLAATAAGLSRQTLLDRVNGKNALCAQTASVAMAAVDLARAGIVGAPHFLTGEYGYSALMADGRARFAAAVVDLGSRHSVEEVSVKPFPCCRATHQLIDLALRLRARDTTIAQRIARVTLHVPQPTFDICGRPFDPGSNPRVSAQFSLAYTVALALRQGHVGLADFEPARVLNDQEGHALAARVESVAFPLNAGEGQYDLAVRFECTLANGETVTLTTVNAKGSASYPLTAEEREAKLTDCTRGMLSHTDVASLRHAVAHLENGDWMQIMAILRRVEYHADASEPGNGAVESSAAQR